MLNQQDINEAFSKLINLHKDDIDNYYNSVLAGRFTVATTTAYFKRYTLLTLIADGTEQLQRIVQTTKYYTLCGIATEKHRIHNINPTTFSHACEFHDYANTSAEATASTLRYKRVMFAVFWW